MYGVCPRPGGGPRDKITVFPFRVRFEPAQNVNGTSVFCNTRCQPLWVRQSDMRKITTRLRFLSRERGIYAPLVHGTPSRSYSTMSHPAPTPTTETVTVSPGVRKDDLVSTDTPVVSSQTYGEPIVTRKELWSYYRKSCSSSLFPAQHFVIPSVLQRRQRARVILLFVRVMLRFQRVWVVSRVLVPMVSLPRLPQGREISTHKRLFHDPLSVSRYCCGL